MAEKSKGSGRQRKKMPKGTPFKKGKSGNPSGMPKGYKEIRDLARQLCPEALEILAERMRSEDEKVSMYAAEKLLDRGYGKAPIAVTGEDGGPIRLDLSNLSDEQLRVVLPILNAATSTT